MSIIERSSEVILIYRLFNGKYISITRQNDGTLRPNFKPMKIDEHFSTDGYAFKVYLELLKALLGLVGK